MNFRKLSEAAIISAGIATTGCVGTETTDQAETLDESVCITNALSGGIKSQAEIALISDPTFGTNNCVIIEVKPFNVDKPVFVAKGQNGELIYSATSRNGNSTIVSACGDNEYPASIQATDNCEQTVLFADCRGGGYACDMPGNNGDLIELDLTK
jgi:hypothetical protein